ncbi:MAG: tetratricopeptide repeat protein [Candidatus Cloacimonetes bacterium]|nr:tetratricopeptide repeat protein [Candidatus Cloacimonadota bacterium]
MKNLIPNFILKKFEQKKYSGELEAVTMFIDISGFTDMTHILMKNGKEGAEILTEIINQVFTPSIDVIHKNGGFISTFAGDAFTSIFPIETTSILNALSAALEINKAYKKIGLQKTKYGEFHLAVKIGLSVGRVDWKIIQNEKQNSYYFRGEAINNCAYSEHQCGQDEIIFDKNFYHEIHKKHEKDIEFTQKTTEYFILKKLNKTISLNLSEHFEAKSDLSNSIQENFVSKSIVDLKTKGEFREIISCFISFTETTNFEKYISKVITLTNRFGGYFNKIDFGDKGGVMLILFGAPSGKEKLFRRACDFALLILNLQGSGNFEDFQTRIGLTFGTEFAGFVGSKKRIEYTALGMVVNLSARFMMKADWNEIYIDRFIYRNVKDKYEIDKLRAKNFKGFSEKISVYKLIKMNKIIQKSSYEGKVVEREKELQKLTEFIQPIYEGKFGGIVYVNGIAGIGKSRLVNEMKERGNRKEEKGKSKEVKVKNKKEKGKKEKAREEINWFYMPCDEILRKSFNPIIHFFKEYFKQSEENLKEINRSNFEKKLDNLIKNTENIELKNELLRTKSILGALLNIRWEESLYEQVDAKGRYENTLFALKCFIKAESLQKPVIIELDDGHWIDFDSKKFLEVLTRNVQDFPFIIISTCRYNDDGSEFGFNFKEVTEQRINLEHLSKTGSKALIEEKLAPIIPEKTLDLISNKSEGNPFFIEQIILYLKENQLFDENFDITQSAINMKIPSNINAIIVARIDRLTMDLKEVIKTASVIGREFAIRILSEMLSNQPLEKHLLEGKREAIWDVLTDLKYIFKHGLIRDAIYEMQLKKELRKLHKLAAQVIEKYCKNEIKTYYPDLANHYEKAEIWDKAIEFLEKAGNYAKENYENENAIEFYNRLLQISNIKLPISKCLDTLLKKGQILQIIGKWKETEDIFLKAINLSEKVGDKHKITKCTSALGKQYYLKGDYSKSLQCFKKQIEIGKELCDNKIIASAVGNMGVLYHVQGNLEKAMENYEKQLKTSEELQDKPSISVSIGNMGLIYQIQGNYEKAMECYNKRYNISKEIGNEVGISSAYGNMGTIYRLQGNCVKSMKVNEKMLRICEKLGDKRGVAVAIGQIGSIYKEQGNFEEAKKCVLQNLKVYMELGDKRGITQALENMGVVYSIQAKYEKAMKYYEKSLKSKEELGDKIGMAHTLGNIGQIYTVRGNYQKAIECYSRKLKISEKYGYKRGISETNQSIGILYENQGDFDKALKYYDKAIEINMEKGFKPQLSEAFFSKANCLFKMHKYNEANECNENCYEIAKKINLKENIFFSNVLKEKINFKLSDNNQIKSVCLKNLKTLINEQKKNEHIAILNYEISLMLNELEEDFSKYSDLAISLYKKLYNKIQHIEYKNKIEELEKL